jgi:hypothetical protein
MTLIQRNNAGDGSKKVAFGLDKVDKNKVVNNDPSTLKKACMVFTVKSFDFEDEKTKIKKQGVSLTVSDGAVVMKDDFKGVLVEKYSIETNNYSEILKKCPEPPFEAICTFKPERKSMVLLALDPIKS